MKTISLAELDLLAFGNSITQWGAVYTSGDTAYFLPFPDEGPMPPFERLLVLTPDEWETVLRQTDVVDVRGPEKAVLRKGQRLIDSHIAWAVFRRDQFRCRYCWAEAPLTVDHVDLWESGGATVPQNLLAACKPCNKRRGNTPYEEWVVSPAYRSRAKDLPRAVAEQNEAVVARLPALRDMRVERQRSR